MPKVKIRRPLETDLDTALRDGMPQTFARLADMHRLNGRFDDAESICRDGLEEFPNYGTGHMVLALTSYGKGEVERALIELHSALKCEPDNILALKLIADIHWEAGQVSLARSYYRQVLQLDRHCDVAFERVKHGRRAEPQTRPVQERPVEMNEGNTIGDRQETTNTVTLARLYAQQGHIDLARQVCEGILEKEPDNNRVKDFLNELSITAGKTNV